MTIWKAYWTLVTNYKINYELKNKEVSKNIGRIYKPEFVKYDKDYDIDMKSINNLAIARGITLKEVLNEILVMTNKKVD